MNILIVGTTSILSKKLISILEPRSDINIFFKKHTFESVYDINSNHYPISNLLHIDILIFLSTLKVGLCSDICKSNIIYPLELIEKMNQAMLIINIDTTSYEYRCNTYSLSKKNFKHLLNINHYKSINLRIEHIYGYYPSKNITSDLIKKMLIHENINLSSGEQIRNFIYVDDAASAIVKCIDNIEQIKIGSTIDIASDDRLSIKKLALILKKITHSQSVLNFGTIIIDQDEFKTIKFDNSVIKKFGWKQSVSLTDGLTREIEEVKNEIFKK